MQASNNFRVWIVHHPFCLIVHTIVNYVSPANPKNGVMASVSNESGRFRSSEGKEVKGVYRGGGLR